MGEEKNQIIIRIFIASSILLLGLIFIKSPIQLNEFLAERLNEDKRWFENIGLNFIANIFEKILTKIEILNVFIGIYLLNCSLAFAFSWKIGNFLIILFFVCKSIFLHNPIQFKSNYLMKRDIQFIIFDITLVFYFLYLWPKSEKKFCACEPNQDEKNADKSSEKSKQKTD